MLGGLFGGALQGLFACRLGLGLDFEGYSVTSSAEKVELMRRRSSFDQTSSAGLSPRCLSGRQYRKDYQAKTGAMLAISTVRHRGGVAEQD